MDLKQPGNLLYLVGETKNELGGSHFALVNDLEGGAVPTVDVPRAKATFAALHGAISAGLVAACHDLSEGGLAAAAAEMAFAGGVGAEIALSHADDLSTAALLFSESNTRFVCEIDPSKAARFKDLMSNVPVSRIGMATANDQLTIRIDGRAVIETSLKQLKNAWQRFAF
jgi:phosphoribosylformylglycinamidine synthase